MDGDNYAPGKELTNQVSVYLRLYTRIIYHTYTRPTGAVITRRSEWDENQTACWDIGIQLIQAVARTRLYRGRHSVCAVSQQDASHHQRKPQKQQLRGQ